MLEIVEKIQLCEFYDPMVVEKAGQETVRKRGCTYKLNEHQGREGTLIKVLEIHNLLACGFPSAEGY